MFFFQVDLKKSIIGHSSPWSPWAIFEAKHKDFKAFWRFPGSQLASPAGLRDVFVQVNLKKMIFNLKKNIRRRCHYRPEDREILNNNDLAAVLRN